MEQGGIVFMKIEKAKIDTLISPDWNPRQITENELEKLETSLNEFGYIEPIIVNDVNNHIVGGNQRCKALKTLGYTEVDVVYVHIEDMAREKACNVALNKISGDWDNDKLKIVLEDIELSDIDISLTGFEELELTEMEVYEEPSTEDIVEDNYEPEEDIEVNVEHGDLFRLGNHYLMCGDSTLKSDVEKLLSPERERVLIDLVFTDPPWNVNYGNVEPGNPMGYKTRTIINDYMETDEFKEFMNKVFQNMNWASKEGAITYVVMSAQEWGNLMLTLKENNYHWSSTIIWKKDRLVLSRKDYHTQYEPIFYGWKEGAPRLHPLKDRKQSDVWDIERPHVSEEHPTMKPIELVSRAVLNSSNRGDAVLDLFAGSGSTLIACEQTNRINFSMELDPHYCQVIINRWEEFTGGKAIKIN